MDLIVRMLDHHLWLSGEILDRSGTLPDSVLDDPITLSVDGIDESPTLRTLGARLVTQLEMWLGALDGASQMPEPGDSSRAALRGRLDRAGPDFRSRMLSVLEQGRVDNTFLDATCQPPQVFSHGGVLAHVLTFSAVRRTMAVGALENAGVTDLRAGDPMAFVGGSGQDASTITRD